MIAICSLAFFLSGLAALLYQVIWQRLLVIFSGADLYSVTIIVAAFMAGLGLGHLAGGHVADRVSARRGMLLFAGAEIAIALFGLASVTLYYDLLYLRYGHLQIPVPAMAALLFVSLLWPTFFMGASLPLLARALSRHLDRAASIIGVLYGMNTLGAATGALLSTWLLIPRFGLDGSLRVGVALNLACAALLLPVAVALGRGEQRKSGEPQKAHGHAPVQPVAGEAGAGVGLAGWVAAYALSGLLALSLEIVWFRMLAVMMKSTAFTFGTLLWLYLTGIGAGSLVGSIIAPRLRHPAGWFLSLQAGVAASAIVLIAVFIRTVDDTPLWSYLGSYEPLNVRENIHQLLAGMGGPVAPGLTDRPTTGNFLVLYLAVPAMLVLPPTLLMGCSFPVLQRAAQTSTATIGRRVGILLLANILGSVLGTVLTGWLLLDWVGTSWTLRLLAGIGGVFALAAFLSAAHPLTAGRSRRLAVALLLTAAVTAALQLLIPGSALLWAHLHGAREGTVVIGEDGSGLSVISAGSQQAVVYVNGIGQSRMPYGDIHTALGALPAFLHPSPTTAVVIGLGSGDTVHAVAGRSSITQIDSVEIIRGQLRTLEALRQRFPYPGLVTLLADSRVKQVFADGRIHLQRGARRYDIIEADALRPTSAYSGNLYSDAYFELVKRNLTPNGLAATWAPTQRVYNTFIRTFPHVVAASGILVGSQQPIVLDRAAIDARLAEPFTRSHFARAGIDIKRLLDAALAQTTTFGPDHPRAGGAEINTDLFPRDEFDLSPPAAATPVGPSR